MGPVALAWMAACHRASIDQIFNDLTMFACLDSWTAATFPAHLAGLEVVASLYRVDFESELPAPIELKVRLVVHPPASRQAVVAAEGPFMIDGLRARARFTLSPFSFLTAGRYWFGLEWLEGETWTELGRTPVDLSEGPTEPATAEAVETGPAQIPGPTA